MKKVILSLVTALVLGGCVIEDPEGDYSINWSITVDGRAGTCAEVGASAVRFTSTEQVTGDRFVDDFNNCGANGGITAPMTEGRYSVVAQLLDGNTPFGPTVTFTIDVFANQTTTGGTAVFPFVFVADAFFRVQMGNGTTSNCGTTQGGGAGVVTEAIEIYDAGGQQCLTGFDIVGVTNENNQPVTRSTCSEIVCQLNNTVHTILELDGGDYDIRVVGYKGATSGNPYPCYVSQKVRFSINGVDANLGTIVAPFTSSLDARCDATKPEE